MNATLAMMLAGQVSVSVSVALPLVAAMVSVRRNAIPVVASVVIDCTVPCATTSVSLSTLDSHAPKKWLSVST